MELAIITARADELCKTKSIDKRIYTKSGAGKDFVSNIKKGSAPSVEKVYALADYLDCSVDYLLGRTDNPQAHKIAESVTVDTVTDNHGLIGNTHAPVTINSAAPDKQETALLEVYKRLTPVQQAKLLVYADEMTKGEEKR